MKFNLSKSQYIKGIFCHRHLWLYKNSDIKEAFDASSKAIMDTGTSVGELAQSLYPGGVVIDKEYNKIKEAEEHTKREIQNEVKTIFEATAINPEGNYSRIDILNKVGKNEWDLIEVKSSASIHDYYQDDIAFQRHVFESAGYKIRKSILMHINNTYVKNGRIDPKQLFIADDLTDIARDKIKEVKNNIKTLSIMVAKKDCEPKRLTAPKQCNEPYPCGYQDYCWKAIPEYSLLNVLSNCTPSARPLREALFNAAKYLIKDLPTDFPLNKKEIIDLASYKEDKTIIDKKMIREFLTSLEYPLYYFDYETIMPAVPIYDGTRPFQVIPFQFSLHKQENDGTLTHIEFLHEDTTDPREDLIKVLIKNIGKTGTILAHHASYEKRMNSELAEAFPKYEKELNAINERLVDSKTPFSNRWIYNYKVCSSASLKSILPVYCPDLSYKDLEIQEGGTASAEYLRAISFGTSQKERKEIFKNLRKYCKLDTYAMVRLIEILRKSIST